MAARRYESGLYYAAKGAVYYVTIATVIFSRVKITCYFHM